MHHSLLFNFLYCLYTYTILLCNGKRNIEDYNFIALHSLRGVEEKLNYDDSKRYCEMYNGILAVISSKSLNDKAVDQLPNEIINDIPYYIDLGLQASIHVRWGNKVAFNRRITPDFDFNKYGPAPESCVYLLKSAKKYSLFWINCQKKEKAICLVPPRHSTNTNRIMTTTTPTAITNTAKTIDSKLTMTHQTSNQTKENKLVKGLFPVVIAIVTCLLVFGGFLCFAFYDDNSAESDSTDSEEDDYEYYDTYS